MPAHPQQPAATVGPIALIGGSGELGHLFVARLVEQGVEDIRVIDLRPYDGPEPVTSYVCDIAEPGHRPRLEAALAGARSVVSMVMPPLLTARAVDYVRCNVRGVGAALDAARSTGVRSFVYVSSIAVMDHFVEHVLYDKPTIAPGADGLAVQQMLNALYRSAENNGSEVKIR